MRTILFKIIQIALLGITAIFLGWNVWFSLWMHHGWPGPPGVLARLLGADGERAYDATMDEMSIICFFALLGFWQGTKAVLRRNKRRKREHTKNY